MTDAPRPKKRFGQHFLRDARVLERIVRAFRPHAQDVAVEIGPGPGALTRALHGQVAHLHAVELDRDLAARLRSEFSQDPRITIHQADALRFDYCALARGTALRIVGNLPYNISTPLLFHLLDQADCIRDMLFMLQKEVVDRLAARSGDKDYGRLSVMVQARCGVERLFDVAPGAFSPPPKVDSSVVRLRPDAAPALAIADPAQFARLVQTAFAQRRKTLRNNLKPLIGAEEIAAVGIDPGRRPETLSLAEFASLSNILSGRRKPE